MSERAAFFSVERTILKRGPLHTAAWFAANAQRVGERLFRLGGMGLALPFRVPGPWTDHKLAGQLGWAALRGMSEDRLLTLGEEYTERFHRPNLNHSGLDLMKRARHDGLKIIWVSDSVEAALLPLARDLQVDDLICNRLELRNHKATGKLIAPIVAGTMSGQWANQYAQDHHLDLSQSSAYGGLVQHSVLLSAIGKPCTVNPDRAMRSMARNLNWPIVEGE